MRTKAGETKRYSLRNVEQKNFASEDELVHTKEEKMEKCLPSGSTKRKRTKPEKTLNNKRLNVEVVPEQEVSPKIIELEQAQREEKAIEVLVEAKEKENNKQKDVKKTNNVDQSSSVSVEKPVEAQPKEEEKNAPDMPVYQALGHAYSCKLANCPLSKCLIAKQFLEHYSTCNSGSEKCNICKAMDIMVRKHAQICQTALEKCPIPKCDKVRLKVLDEWFEFSSLLRHAKACKDKSCDINKCKNIKLMFFHSIKCHKSDTCKTKAFVRQLCKYYKQEQELMASTNGHQDTDFYTELLKRKKQELERQNQLLQIQQLLLACNNMPNLSSQNLLNTMSNNNDNNHNHGLDMPEGPMMYANSWGTNLLPLTNNNQCFYPNNMTYDSLSFNQQQMFDASNLNDQYDIPLENATDDVSDASISYPIPGDENEEEEEHTVNEFLGTEQQADLYKVSSTNNSNTKTPKDDTLLNLPSPARKIFNKLWAEKMGGVDDDNMRNVLIDLSPDLILLAQNSVSRSQFISPVSSNRQYSEMPTEYDLACPNDDDGGEEDPLPPMKSIRAKFNKMEDYLTMKRSYSGLSEAQSEWCKIDFVKQHEPDDANKIKDKAPAKLIPPTPPQTKVQQGFVVQDQKPANNPAPGLTSSKSLTSIEQTFLDLIKQQNYQKVSGSVNDK